jgi:hypothetical protein
VSELQDFFTSLPAAAAALWRFIDGWYGVAVTVGSVVLTAACLFAAKRLRDDQGWLSAIFGMMAATIAAWWAFGILPSAWIYFVDSQKDVLAAHVIPNAIDPVWSNFYNFFRDVVVMAETTLAMGLFALIALRIQSVYPRALAEGEDARPQSGGYK